MSTASPHVMRQAVTAERGRWLARVWRVITGRRIAQTDPSSQAREAHALAVSRAFGAVLSDTMGFVDERREYEPVHGPDSFAMHLAHEVQETVDFFPEDEALLSQEIRNLTRASRLMQGFAYCRPAMVRPDDPKVAELTSVLEHLKAVTREHARLTSTN